MRLDKFLTLGGLGTRSEVKKLIKNNKITINGQAITDEGYHIDENSDQVCYEGKALRYQKYIYVMLNKPAGYITSTSDREPTVMDIIQDYKHLPLAPVGRLDKDTEGLLLITNDGALAHMLTSPKKHIDKTYYVELASPIKKEDMLVLEKGIMLDNEITLPARLTFNSPQKGYITIQEGKYHQVKRMFHYVDNQVTYLKRVSMGSLNLDESLALGEYRELTIEEIEKIKHQF